MQIKHAHIGIGIVIFLLACALRLYGINWDQGTHTHPDERFLTMVVNKIDWPTNISEYFDTNTSPLNPHNNKFSFYVYGTWPIIATKSIAQAFNRDTYDLFPLVGRIAVILTDLATLLMVYLIAKTVTNRIPPALYAMFLYAITVLPIQLTHFFTVDPFVVLYVTISTYFLIKGLLGAPLGVAMGLAVGTKISSVIMFPIICIQYLLVWPFVGTQDSSNKIRIKLLLTGIIFAIVFYAILRIVYPYLFVGMALNPKVLANWRELASFDSPTTNFPPGLQWVGTMPFFYSLKQLIVWGLGIPYGILATVAFIHATFVSIQTKKWNGHATICLIIVGFFIYQSTQFAKAMRYLGPIYPHIAIISGIYLEQLARVISRRIKSRTYRNSIFIGVTILLLAWPIMFSIIYSRPNTRVAASDWIYNAIPKKSTIAWEHWDDPLPISRGENSIQQYKTEQLAMFSPDSPKKWREITEQLARSNYIILSSNRVYGGTGQVAKRFIQTYRYYQLLFSNTLGFTLVHQEVSRPTLPLPWISICLRIPGFSYGTVAQTTETCQSRGVSIIDDYADETFTVYDHPKVLIFQNVRHLSQDVLYDLIVKNDTR